MLVHPQESIDLKNESKNRRELAVTSLAFPENETNVLYVGAEDGSICQVHIHGAKPGVTESYDGHDGPVTGIDLHPTGDAAQHGVERFTDLAVSCSFDWSVKLWSVKQFQSPVLSIDTFEDYVYAAQWHPLHPAVFATVDGEGHVDLWNLNKDLEGPICRCDSAKRLALNKCHWSPDGKQLVTGDSWGTLGIYMADRSITEPRKDAFQQFEEKVQKFEPLTGGRGDSGGFGHDSRFGIPSRTHAGF
jgi:dynein intermediate chain